MVLVASQPKSLQTQEEHFPRDILSIMTFTSSENFSNSTIAIEVNANGTPELILIK